MHTLLFLGSSTDILRLDLQDTFVVTMHLSDEIELRKTNPNVKFFHRHAQSPQIWENIIKYSRNWLSNVSSTKLNVNDISLWEFVYDEFLEIPGGVFDQIYYMKTIVSFIEENIPKKIEMKGTFQFDLSRIIEALSKIYQFEFVNNSSVIQNKKKQERVLGNKILFLERLLAGKIASLFYKKRFDSSFVLTHGFMAKKINTTISDLYVDELHESLIKSDRKPLVISLNLPRNHKNILLDITYDFCNIIRGQYRPLSTYVPLSYLIRRKSSPRDYENQVKKFIKDSCLDFRVDDISIFPFIEDEIANYLARRIHDAVVNMDICKRYLRKETPDRILNIEGSNLFGKALTWACSENGIKIFAIQLGIISKEIPVNSSFFIPKNYNQKLVPTIFVWGKYHKDILLERGYPESKIIEIGFYRNLESRKTGKSDFGKYVLYVASANVTVGTFISTIDEEITTIKELRKIIPKETAMVIKLHPTLPSKQYEESFKEQGIFIADNFKYKIEDLVSNADTIIGKCSTLLLQSTLQDKRVIWINLISSIDFCGLISNSIIQSLESFKDHFNKTSKVRANLKEDLLSISGITSREMLVSKFYEEK